MGEGVAEATIIDYVKNIGDEVAVDDVIAEIATDKVDTEVTSPVSGVLVEILFKKDDVVSVGQVIAVVETTEDIPEDESTSNTTFEVPEGIANEENAPEKNLDFSATKRFYSPLIKNIARVEGISVAELEKIQGTGLSGRVTKNDVLLYLKNGRPYKNTASPKTEDLPDEIIPMSRMRRLIAQNMVASVAAAPQVTSITDVDVTRISKWRKGVKDTFFAQKGEKLTYTPVFIMAVARALKDFPMINVSVKGNDILRHQSINIGMAVALPSGDLIVPVIRHADTLSLSQMAHAVNDLSTRARNGKLKPEEIHGGTFTVTNIGSFGTLFGTPILNMPEVAILGIGAIQKVPAVIQCDGQDVIAIREKMFLSLTIDHRVIDGALGGLFAKRVVEYMENWNTEIEF